MADVRMDSAALDAAHQRMVGAAAVLDLAVSFSPITSGFPPQVQMSVDTSMVQLTSAATQLQAGIKALAAHLTQTATGMAEADSALGKSVPSAGGPR